MEMRVRFNEVDPLGITWHGHYIRYFEDGRESFGNRYGLTYLDVYNNGLVTPIVSINCNYRKSLTYDERAIVETTFVDHPAAKLLFEYKIFTLKSNELVAEGSSVQVFLDNEHRQLQLSTPAFIENWKRQHLV